MTRTRLLMTTTAYPPSTGGVQAHIADVRRQLTRYEADAATLWLENRTDWLLGTTLRLKPRAELPNGATLGWTASTRWRMVPWVLSYYALVPVAAERLAGLIAPDLDRLVRPDHALIHNHRIGREFLGL